jgi:t-SNARE complex subunit (syntaxin)
VEGQNKAGRKSGFRMKEKRKFNWLVLVLLIVVIVVVLAYVRG